MLILLRFLIFSLQLSLCAHSIVDVIEKHYKGTSSSLIIQDGPDSGQSVSHVHLHVIPRKRDDVTGEVHHHIEELRESRTPEDMAAEARELRTLFEKDPLNTRGHELPPL